MTTTNAERAEGTPLLTSEERRAQRGTDLFASIFDHAAIGMAVVDGEGHIVESNPALAAMLGYSEVGLQGKSYVELTHPDDVAPDQRLFEELVAGLRSHYQMEKRYIRRDGSLMWGRLTVSLVPACDDGPPLGMGMVEDITDRKRLEDRLRRTERMDAIVRVTRGIAHDFNNLIAIIQNYAVLAQEDLDPSESAYDDLEEIKQGASRAASLARQLMVFGRGGKVESESLRLNDVISDMRQLLDSSVGRHIDVQLELDERLWPIEADRDQIGQVLLNLALNSRDAMADGGHLMIRTENVTLAQADVQSLGDVGPGRYVSLIVSDTGQGMEPEVLAHLFEPFFTTKGSGGTGLGLATVYGIVKRLGGTVSVDSHQGTGTVIHILLPVPA